MLQVVADLENTHLTSVKYWMIAQAKAIRYDEMVEKSMGRSDT
jgi:hypothetical protein